MKRANHKLCICIYENPNNFTKTGAKQPHRGERGALCKLAETFSPTMSWNLLVMATLGLGHLAPAVLGCFSSQKSLQIFITLTVSKGWGGGRSLYGS